MSTRLNCAAAIVHKLIIYSKCDGTANQSMSYIPLNFKEAPTAEKPVPLADIFHSIVQQLYGTKYKVQILAAVHFYRL